jgi:N-acetylmuramoyl-L-alanine amidase
MRLLLTAVFVAATALPALAQSAPVRYETALAREQQVRASQPPLRTLRSLIAQYEAIVQRYPQSGYSDNALWQAAGVAWLAFERHGQEIDRRTALRLLQQLKAHYPKGTLAGRVPARLAEFSGPSQPRRPASQVARPDDAPRVDKAVASGPAPAGTLPSAPAPIPPAEARAAIRITDVMRSALPSGERITIAMDREPQYHEERLSGPDRLFFDFRDTAAADSAKPSLERLSGGVVRDVRLGERPERTTRLVLELEPDTRHSVFALYNPNRLVVDLERAAPASAAPAPAEAPVLPKAALPAAPPPKADPPRADPTRDAGPPVVPLANSNGSFSLARQLGLGVARIVIDPGHGGHDPGAIANRAREAEVVLDIALRLEKLLL